MYQYICLSVCDHPSVCVSAYFFRVLDFVSSPKIWPFKTVSVTTYTVVSSLVFVRGIWVAYALHVKLWFSSKTVQASKTTTTTTKKTEGQINQSKIPIGKPHNGTSGESWNPFSLPLAITTPCHIFGIHTACLETTKPRVTQHNNCFSLSSHTF